MRRSSIPVFVETIICSVAHSVSRFLRLVTLPVSGAYSRCSGPGPKKISTISMLGSRNLHSSRSRQIRFDRPTGAGVTDQIRRNWTNKGTSLNPGPPGQHCPVAAGLKHGWSFSPTQFPAGTEFRRQESNPEPPTGSRRKGFQGFDRAWRSASIKCRSLEVRGSAWPTPHTGAGQAASSRKRAMTWT